jgi:hypothetical protein
VLVTNEPFSKDLARRKHTYITSLREMSEINRTAYLDGDIFIEASILWNVHAVRFVFLILFRWSELGLCWTVGKLFWWHLSPVPKAKGVWLFESRRGGAGAPTVPKTQRRNGCFA